MLICLDHAPLVLSIVTPRCPKGLPNALPQLILISRIIVANPLQTPANEGLPQARHGVEHVRVALGKVEDPFGQRSDLARAFALICAFV